MSFLTRLGAARAAFSKSLLSTGEPCAIGKKILEHQIPQDVVKRIQSIGWHAGPKDKLDSQIQQGRFDDLGIDLYYAKDARHAAHFGAKDIDPTTGSFKESVLVEVVSTEVSQSNEQFGHYYVPSGPENFIGRVHEISEDYMRVARNPKLQMGIGERAYIALNEAYSVLTNQD